MNPVPAGFNVFILFSGLAGALLGGIVTVALGLWKFHRDEYSARCDELSKVLLDAAALSAEYWSQSFIGENAYKGKMLEAKILGMQVLIDGLAEQVAEQFWASDNANFSKIMSEMADGLTGGDFSVSARDVDIERIVKSSQVAGELIAIIRLGHRHTMPYHKWLKA